MVNRLKESHVLVAMFVLGLKRTIASLLAATLLSSQLFASVPGLCGCLSTDAADEVESCCGGLDSRDSDAPQCCATSDEGSCRCDDECGQGASDCTCGCSKSHEKKAPNQGNNRERVGQDAVPELAGSSLHLILRDSRGFSHGLDSRRIQRISPQILLCVWQI